MSRRVIKTAKGPFELKPQEKSAWICMCGLSKNQPFCDGSHKKVQEEDGSKVYQYNDEGEREEIEGDNCCGGHCCSSEKK